MVSQWNVSGWDQQGNVLTYMYKAYFHCNISCESYAVTKTPPDSQHCLIMRAVQLIISADHLTFSQSGV